MKANKLGIRLTGDRNQCTGCDQLFNSSAAFDKHRVGAHAGNGRRCLGPDEMRAKGMVLGSDGFWRGSEMPENALARKVGEASPQNMPFAGPPGTPGSGDRVEEVPGKTPGPGNASGGATA
jgi:hypothetical protein